MDTNFGKSILYVNFVFLYIYFINKKLFDNLRKRSFGFRESDGNFIKKDFFFDKIIEILQRLIFENVKTLINHKFIRL